MSICPERNINKFSQRDLDSQTEQGKVSGQTENGGRERNGIVAWACHRGQERRGKLCKPQETGRNQIMVFALIITFQRAHGYKVFAFRISEQGRRKLVKQKITKKESEQETWWSGWEVEVENNCSYNHLITLRYMQLNAKFIQKYK